MTKRIFCHNLRRGKLRGIKPKEINNRLFAGATAAQLLHKILDYDPNNQPNISNRSKLFKLIQTF